MPVIVIDPTTDAYEDVYKDAYTSDIRIDPDEEDLAAPDEDDED